MNMSPNDIHERVVWVLRERAYWSVKTRCGYRKSDEPSQAPLAVAFRDFSPLSAAMNQLSASMHQLVVRRTIGEA